MARVILDVPTDKMQPFLQAILQLGLDSHSISSKQYRREFVKPNDQQMTLRSIASSFILFDWEFFSNELEYE